MKRMSIFFILAIMVVLLVAGLKLSNNATSDAASFGISYAARDVGPVIGLKAPDFTLQDLAGQKIKLYDVIKNNKITLVNFWATWCPPCRQEIPDLISFYRKYSSQKVSLLGIDIQEKPEDVKAFVTKNKMNYPVLVDIEAKAARLYNLYAIPTTFIIDRNGKIKDLVQGGVDLKTLETKVKAFLKE